MSFLAPHCDYDVFVSYSHGDSRGGRGVDTPLKRWTVALIRELEAEIRDYDDEFDNLHIWFDEQIDPTAHLTDELRRKVKASGVLLIVMSPRYLSSSWCNDERSWFEEQIVARSREPGRVFVIHALPTDAARWPSFLRDERGHPMLGFRFYDGDGRDGERPKPYGWGLPDIREGGLKFAQQLTTLETALTKRLRQLRDRATVEQAARPLVVAPTVNGSRRVYLHVRNEHADLRDRIKGSLKEDGLMALGPVFPGVALGDQMKESNSRIALAEKCTALALVRAETDTDESFMGDLIDIGVDERQRVEDKRGVPLPCAVLDGSGAAMPLDVADYGMRRFDLGSASWHGEFCAWVKAAQAQDARAPS
jgi:hypothetical protein